MEQWKDIPGYEGLYQVSDLGRVKSLKRKAPCCNGFRTVPERILKPGKNKGGYLKVDLYNGKGKSHRVNIIVAMAFLNHKPNGNTMVVNHINFDKTDNRLENLEIVTNRENSNRKHLQSTSKYVGVSWHKPTKKWQANIYINGKLKYLGLFTDELEASKTYQKALTKIKQNIMKDQQFLLAAVKLKRNSGTDLGTIGLEYKAHNFEITIYGNYSDKYDLVIECCMHKVNNKWVDYPISEINEKALEKILKREVEKVEEERELESKIRNEQDQYERDVERYGDTNTLFNSGY